MAVDEIPELPFGTIRSGRCESSDPEAPRETGSDAGARRVVADIVELWHSRDPAAWDGALARYWKFVLPRNLDLERRMEAIDIERVRRLDAQGWYDFLLQEYFQWKYTARNRYASTTKHLRRYAEEGALAALDGIKDRLFGFDLSDIRAGLSIACEIRGLGPAGASGLLAVMFPTAFGTADQFVVKALRCIKDLPEAATLAKMKPEQLTLPGATELIRIMQRKAAENNETFRRSSWTPRMVDKILWTYGR